MSSLQLNIPDVASKRLAITCYSDGRRKVQISSNLLDMFGFSQGTKVVERTLDSGGYMVELAENSCLPNKVKKIYRREYKTRKSNPFETVFETTSKAILKSIPISSTHVHVTMMYGRLIVKDVIDKVAKRLNKFMTSNNPLTTFSMCSSGVDAAAAQSVGMDIVSALDWRPSEKRDHQDFTESGMLSFLANIKGIKHFFNEDIYDVSSKYIKHVTSKSPSNLLTVSLQCDDFTGVKNSKAKTDSLVDLSSTLDMCIPILNCIRELQFPMILMENVCQFGSSDIGKLWDLHLRRMGYFTFSKNIDCRDHEGNSSRKRLFHFATSLPVPFEWPQETQRSTVPFWDRYIKGNEERFRDVSHSKSIQKGKETGRLRIIDRIKPHSPTPLKSQLRMCKDSVVIEGQDGKILFPDEALLKDLMTIPQSFNLNVVTSTLASEIIGQAVDYKLYQEIIKSVKDHIGLARPMISTQQLELSAV